jgi:hypothetical protein
MDRHCETSVAVNIVADKDLEVGIRGMIAMFIGFQKHI